MAEQKQETPEVQEDELTKAAMDQGAKAAEQAQLNVEVHSLDDIDIDDFEFPEDLDALDDDVSRAEKVLVFDNPRKPDKKINFLVRALTPGEHASLNGTLFPKALLRDTLKEVLNIEQPNKMQLDSPEFQEQIIGKLVEGSMLQNDFDNNSDAKMYRAIVMGVIKPKGLTIERVSKWNPNMLEILYSAIMEELAAKDAVWTFPEMD